MKNRIPQHSTVQSVERVIDILTYVAMKEPNPSLTEISQSLGLSKSTVHRLLSCLRVREVVERDLTGRYQVGALVFQWSTSLLHQGALAALVRPFLQGLRDETNETATFSIPVGRHRVYIEEAVSGHERRLSTPLGSLIPLGLGAAGKALLAYLPEEKRASAIRQWNNCDLPQIDPELFEEELSRIRADGVARTSGERVKGATSIAAPVFDGSGRVMGAISLSGPADRFPADVLEQYAQRVGEVAARVSEQLGYQRR